ncbi:hypothetical protein F4824DRAFT_166894 [Ustulina deusta]|nr:hypothetical protein F4824DRAFT_166894 [Ustulina deusta]
MKFWQKSAKVMIAFVEGETSGMPEGVSLVVADSTGTAASRLPHNTAFGVPQQQTPALGSSSLVNNDSNLEPSDAERSRTGRVEPTSSPQTQGVGRQNVIAHIPSAAPTSVQPRGQPNSWNITGISRIQDVTPLLVEEEEWRKRFTEYKVWTIRPFLSIDQTQTPDDAWDRCVISEEHLNINEIKRRLAALDKNSMTVLEKMTTLAVSQQIQVQQSLEAAKSGASDSAHQWKFRQLEIIRSKRWFRPKHVKRVVVYVCVEPLLQAFKQHEESQRQPIEMEEGASNLPNNGDGRSSFAGRQVLLIEDKKKHKRSRDITDTDIENTVSTENSDWSIGVHKGENEPREWVRKKERKFSRRSEPEDLRRREVERANEAIASRPPAPPVSRGRSPRLSSAYAGTRSPTRLPSPRLASPTRQGPTQPITIANDRYISRRDSDSADESNSSDSDRYQVRYEYPHAIITTGRKPTRDNANDHRSSYSTRPRHRSRSEATSPPYPRLVGYYTDEQLRVRERARARARQSYPDEFDRQPYDPQLSPQAVEARQEAIEQLLLEWTPLYKAENGSDNDDMSPAKPQVHESLPPSPNGQPHSSVKVREEPEALYYVPRPKVETLPSPETKVDVQLETLSENQAQETEAVRGPTPRARTNWTSRLATSQPPLVRLQRRETTDGIGLGKPLNGQLSDASHPQTADGNDDGDIGISLLQKGNRAATLPIAAPQTWTDIDWARQIVEETATVADPDEYEPPLRNPTTAPVRVRELSPRESERQLENELFRARRRRNTERHGSPTARRRARDRSQVDHDEGSFERRPSPPPRRRTVEFEGLGDHHTSSRGRYRDPETTVETGDHVSEPRQRRQSQTRVRDRDPHVETSVEHDGNYRSRPREDRHSSRR